MMLSRKWILAGVLLCLVALVTFAALVPLTAANAPQGNILAYLPFVASQPRPPLGIYGRVNENGVPIPSIPIELRFYDGLHWSTVATVTTDTNAEYHFLDQPGLAPGERYQTRYLNTESNPGRLSAWHGLRISTYTAGADAFGGDMDIGGIDLVAPEAGATLVLPATFTWNLRPVPTDSYEFVLSGEMGGPYFGTIPPLGYVNNFTLHALPNNFEYNTLYFWSVYVYGPGGDGISHIGSSYWAYQVTFVTTPAGPELIVLPNSRMRNPIADLGMTR